MRTTHFGAKNYPIALKESFSKKKKNIYKIFMYLLDFFIVQNFQKILSADQEIWQHVSFLAPNWCICTREKFFHKKHLYNFHIPLGPFYWAKFKKKSLEILKWCICPKEEFSQKNHINNFHAPLPPFHCAKFEKNC